MKMLALVLLVSMGSVSYAGEGEVRGKGQVEFVGIDDGAAVELTGAAAEKMWNLLNVEAVLNSDKTVLVKSGQHLICGKSVNGKKVSCMLELVTTDKAPEGQPFGLTGEVGEQ